MEPVQFGQANFLLQGPPDSGIKPLPVFKSDNALHSCWLLSPRELKQIASTRVIWLGVLGDKHPAVELSSDSPWANEDEDLNAAVQEQLSTLSPRVIADALSKLTAIRHILQDNYALDMAMAMVKEFHQAFGHPARMLPDGVDAERVSMRLGLIEEEFQELRDAVDKKDVVKQADACADLLYVVLGFMVEAGFPAAIFDEVHRSNMTKLGEDGRPVLREDGKSLKGPLYDPPRIAELLESVRETVKKNMPQ